MKVRRLFFLLLLAGFYANCSAQELIDPIPKAKLLTTFSFKQFSGGVIMLRATLGTIKDSLNFILDTGSGGISLDSTTCETYNIKPRPTDTVFNGLGGNRKVSYVFDQTLHLPGLSVDKLNFHVNDYDILTSVYGEKIDGIIGYSFFSRYIVKVNFDKQHILIYSPGQIRYERQGTVLRPFINKIPVQPLRIRDRKSMDYNFYFDTGAGLCFLMSEAFANDSAVLSPKRKPVYTQAEGMVGKVQMKLTVVRSVQIGRYKFNNVPTYIYKDETNVTAYPFNGGLVGNDLLRRFNITFNYPQREIHLVPNTHFRDPFDYAYTGLGIYYHEGAIYIEDVMPGSPGEKAGIKPGDILVAVETNFSNNISQYKNVLQSAKAKIKIFVQRGGDLIELVIKPTSIL
jgi:hypothetical protein